MYRRVLFSLTGVTLLLVLTLTLYAGAGGDDLRYSGRVKEKLQRDNALSKPKKKSRNLRTGRRLINAASITLLTEDFNGGVVPPVGWTVVDNEGTGMVWGNIADAGEFGNYTGASGDAATASSDIFGPAPFDTELRTPSITGFGPNVVISYVANYQNFANFDFLDLDISVDGGASWTTVLSWNEDHGAFRSPPGETVSLPLDSYLGGATEFMLRWHYYDPNPGSDWDWYAQIDDVVITSDEPGPTLPHEFVLLADRDITITKNRDSEGNIHANRNIHFKIGAPSTHDGMLSAVGNIRIDAKNTINGDVVAGGTIKRHAKATINGMRMQNASVPPVPLPSLSFTAGGVNRTVAKQGSLTLPPGSRGVVTVNNGGTLTLFNDGGNGDYFFEKLIFKKSTTLVVDVTDGPVTINVVERLSIGNGFEVVITPGGQASSNFVTFNSRQNGTLKVGKSARVLGSVIAPSATVSFSKNAQIKGGVCAKNIRTAKGVTFIPHGAGTLPKFAPEAESESIEGSNAAVLPDDFLLEQNFPNPFNPSTTIRFALPRAAEVTLTIYNLRGQLLRTLLAGPLAAGRYTVTWDGTSESGAAVPSGLYIYRLNAGDYVATKKMTLLK